MEQISIIHVAIAGAIVVLILTLISSRKVKRLSEALSKEKEKVTLTTTRIKEYEEKYSQVIDIEAECERVKSALEVEKAEIESKSKQKLDELEAQKEQLVKERTNIEGQIANIRIDYKSKKNTYDALSKQIAIFSEDVELIELGFYEPKFDFDASETFKEEIKKCKGRQKALLRERSSSGAIYCYRDWTVDGSRTEGKKMTNKGIRLTARAFNNECEAAIANCTWKNVSKMEERIRKAFSAINQLNESNAISITERYLKEKIQELQLTYEYHEKKLREKEEQAEIKAQMREEARIETEIKKAEAEAIKEERRYQKALDTARQELAVANDETRLVLESQIAELQASLEEAERKHQRAQSMAEQTKQGHVYIISNIGSFGEDVYKIGMTRRLEPMDRVKELGDASVPFTFDVHAMIHTVDAPTLEKSLHDQFDSRRLNMVNRRKEFFNVSLEEIKHAVQGFTDKTVEFIETAVAQDYYETKAMKKQMLLKEGKLNEEEIANSRKLPEFADVL
ncbi:DUF4041 domain-containing protein [Vibrio parahaemolyticus]|nr:DUF4041 domain-containing protein [Vibrio parahaemolyticus]